MHHVYDYSRGRFGPVCFFFRDGRAESGEKKKIRLLAINRGVFCCKFGVLGGVFSSPMTEGQFVVLSFLLLPFRRVRVYLSSGEGCFFGVTGVASLACRPFRSLV